MTRDSKIYIAGHRGLVGSAILRKLEAAGHRNLLYKTRSELDLCDQQAVRSFFERERPEYVFLAAAKVGGIHANHRYPAEFISHNLAMQSNVIDSAWRSGCQKLLFLGSSCIYPRMCPQPIREEYLLTGPLEPTNEWYAVAKIAGIKMCQAYRQQYGFDAISAMPTNLYGPNGNYHPENSHVIPALIRRFDQAKVEKVSEAVLWGSGTQRREFLHVDDLADALVFLMQNYSELEHINVGCGEDVTIQELASLIAETVSYQGKIINDTSKPDGTPRKLLDCSRLFALGRKPKIRLRDGMKQTYDHFLNG
ncbi:GDP-L-fucose synthase [Nitratidesulfovibrio liaohensis]|uniref:GDP-L-fucose synthase n=1 Tax=Nitratidesulfovibrio liaohensis TaxID=2604158 RepID=A0ABY9R649_9BACT|nr:GDP-L-fucose synthase [Nitratidesulfovibrio liaohensis]WMW66283.1 GDP-L-fucose synthase [Nitratidesulfovibrio liaohensis]